MSTAGPPVKQSDERLHRAFAWAIARLPGGFGARARQATGGRFGIGSQIVVGLGGGVLLTISAILLALLLMSIVERGQSEVTQEQIPSLLAGHRVTQHSEALLRASPQLLSAADPAVLEDVRAAVLLEQDSLQFWVGEVGGAAMDADVASLAEDLVANINEIYESVNNRMAYNAGLAEWQPSSRRPDSVCSWCSRRRSTISISSSAPGSVS